MLSTYYAGETYDIREDSTAWSEGGNPFSGGSGIVVKGKIAPQQVKRASLAALFAAILLGIFLQFGLKTGPWTLPLGLTGCLAGYYYSTPPLRWVKRGFGELIIGFCFGWLPVATAFYLQTGSLHPLIFWLSGPIGCTIFNVILLNEFPDYNGDRQAGKKNLPVRLGLDLAAQIYGVVVALAWASLMMGLFFGVPICFAILATPLYLVGGKIYLELRRDQGRFFEPGLQLGLKKEKLGVFAANWLLLDGVLALGQNILFGLGQDFLACFQVFEPPLFHLLSL